MNNIEEIRKSIKTIVSTRTPSAMWNLAIGGMTARGT